MAGLTDNAPYPIPCPHCGQKTEKTFRWLKTHQQFTCRCGKVVRFDAKQALKVADGINRKFAALQKQAKGIKIGK